jgi:hypothetical protein
MKQKRKVKKETKNEKEADEKIKEIKEINKKIKEINEENIIRNLSRKILEYIPNGLNDNTFGIFYKYIHFIYSFLIGFIFLFNNNLLHLYFLLIIIFLNAGSIVVFHGCPLTHLERKYLNTSSCSEYYDFYRNSKIMYKCDHDYERQIEMLVNVFLLVVLKCLTILFLRTFNLKLYNYNNIYE